MTDGCGCDRPRAVYERQALALTVAAAVLGLPLAGCSEQDHVETGHLTKTDIVFVNAVRANTHTLWNMDDMEMALAGRDVCTVLAQGGTVDDAVRLLIPPTRTLRQKQDAAYFVSLAAKEYCPQYRTRKPAPNA